MSSSYQGSYQATLGGEIIISSYMAEMLCCKVHSKPYGGIEWVQKEGWEIRECIRRTTKYAIEDVLHYELT